MQMFPFHFLSVFSQDGNSKMTAMLIVFFTSAFFHEYLISGGNVQPIYTKISGGNVHTTNIYQYMYTSYQVGENVQPIKQQFSIQIISLQWKYPQKLLLKFNLYTFSTPVPLRLFKVWGFLGMMVQAPLFPLSLWVDKVHCQSMVHW